MFQKFSHGLNQIKLYQGDSGSPIWIYHMGMAYQIGIYTSGTTEKEGCGHLGGGVYIPEVMDWVLKIIKDN